MPGSGGLCKLRWRRESGGKRGGVRVIYYWVRDDDTIYFLTMYPKTRQDDLSPRQVKILRRIVQEELS
ncbi:MAG: type II toxin-antitoxin system RelE/ParE family toxin [bacterium]|nr:type II toxin-antitoxin system RelE/ParE family toxin [bacterium]